MNEKAIQDAFILFSSKGYDGDIDSFKDLIKTNPQALNDTYSIFSSKGYDGDINQFSDLMGINVVDKKKEEPTRYSEGVLGDFLGGVLDRGIAQGRSVDEGMDLLIGGSSASESEIQEYYDSVMNAQSYQPSEGMMKFQKEYKEGGEDFAAFGSALLNNLSVAPEVFFESMISMGVGATENKTIVAAGAGAGAAAGAVGGLGVGAVPGAFLGGFAAAGGALEATATLTELIQEELSQRQLDFNPQNIREILSDEKAFKSIRNKSIARGGIIGAIDLITGGIAGKATSVIAKTGKVLSKTAGATVGLAIEGAGGSLGEATARAAIGQEMDAAEIGLEGIAGFSTAPISIGVPLAKSPTYTINGKSESRKTAYDVVESMTDDQLASSEFTMQVKNDEYLANVVDERKKKHKIKNESSDIITDEKDLLEVVEKQYELDKLKEPKNRAQKRKAEQLQKDIDVIVDKYLKVEEVVEEAVAEETVVEDETKAAAEEETVSTKDQAPVEEVLTEEEAKQKSKERVDRIVDGIIKKTVGRLSKDVNPKKKLSNILSYVQNNSKLYAELNDSEREALVLELTKKAGIPIEKSPSIAKILGKSKPEKVTITVDPVVEYRNQLKKEAKVARDAKKYTLEFINEKRSLVGEKIKSIYKGLNLTPVQTRAILNRVNNLNPFNEKSIDSFMDYADKLANDSELASKISLANKLKKVIRKNSSNPKIEANTSAVSKQFSKFDIDLVSDIDQFLDVANKIRQGLKSSVKSSKGLNVKESVVLEDIYTFINAQQEIQDAANQQRYSDKLSEINEMFGSMTEQEIQDYYKKKQEFDDEKSASIKSQIKNAFKGSINDVLSISETLSDDLRSIVKSFSEIDLDIMDTDQSIRLLDALVDFTANQNTGGISTILKEYEGVKNLDSLLSDDVTGKGVSSFPEWIKEGWMTQIANLPIVFEYIFNGQIPAGKVMKSMGLSDIIKGASDAVTKLNEIEDSYSKTFSKKTTKDGTSFNSSYNIAERGAIAFLMRTVNESPEAQNAEFSRKKQLILESIATLKSSTRAKDLKMANVYESLFADKIEAAQSIEDVLPVVDKVNVEAVEFWQKQWASKYDQLSQVSLDVYNNILGQDVNYTPDNISKIEAEVNNADPLDLEAFNPAYSSKAYDKKSGTLIQNTRPKTLPEGSYVNLNFDSMNVYKMKSALTDINTAADIRKLNSFLKSKKGMSRLIPDPTSRRVVTSRIKEYIKKTRGIGDGDRKTNSSFNKAINSIAKLGVAKALGGITQYPKQLIPPLVNTFINAGNLRLDLFNNPDVRNFIKSSGYAVANRGFESEANIGKLNKQLGDISSSANVALETVDKINSFYLKNFLVAPDRIAAQSSWITYYAKALSEKGVNVDSIDWTNHKIDTEAGNYAQQQLDRQQNVSDTNLQGLLFSSDNMGASLARKMLFPFMNFAMNQKSRFYSDVSVISSKLASKEDKELALRSLGGLTAETVAFNSIAYGISYALYDQVAKAAGFEESEEEKEKRSNSLLKGRATNIVSDALSPIPFFTDPLIIPATNKILSLLQVEDEDTEQGDIFQLYEKKPQEFIEMLGVLGIGASKSKILTEMIEARVTGTYTTEFMGKKRVKEISQEGMDVIENSYLLYTLYSLGLAPLEFGRIAEYQMKMAKKLSK